MTHSLPPRVVPELTSKQAPDPADSDWPSTFGESRGSGVTPSSLPCTCHLPRLEPQYEKQWLEAVCGAKLIRKDLAPSLHGLPNRVDCVNAFSELNDPNMFPESY